MPQLHPFDRRALLAAGAALTVPRLARGQAALPRVRFTMDWAFQGPSAYALLARERGFFRDAGVDVALSRGFGSGRTPIDVAAGTFDMGQGDINPTIKFMAENPGSGLVVVAITGDRSGLCVTSLAEGPVRAPRDLEGRTLCAPDVDAGRQMFPAFARLVGIDLARVNWMTVRAELREPMLVQGRADAITGIVTSTALSLKALGVPESRQRVMLYRDHGLDLYATCWMTTRAFLEREPAAVRATVAALMRAQVATWRRPEEAMAALRAAEPLSEIPIEMERYRFNAEQHLVTDNVRANGLGAVDPARLQRGIEAVEVAFGLPHRLRADAVYTDAYLPPRAARML